MDNTASSEWPDLDKMKNKLLAAMMHQAEQLHKNAIIQPETTPQDTAMNHMALGMIIADIYFDRTGQKAKFQKFHKEMLDEYYRHHKTPWNKIIKPKSNLDPENN